MEAGAFELLCAAFSPEPNTGCWIPDSPDSILHRRRPRAERNAYARVHVDGEQFTGHRFALEQKLGRPLRRGFIACHTCPNKWCGNPAHLYEGTYSQNTSDAHRPKQIRRALALLNRLYADERAMFARARVVRSAPGALPDDPAHRS